MISSLNRLSIQSSQSTRSVLLLFNSPVTFLDAFVVMLGELSCKCQIHNTKPDLQSLGEPKVGEWTLPEALKRRYKATAHFPLFISLLARSPCEIGLSFVLSSCLFVSRHLFSTGVPKWGQNKLWGPFTGAPENNIQTTPPRLRLTNGRK